MRLFKVQTKEMACVVSPQIFHLPMAFCIMVGLPGLLSAWLEVWTWHRGPSTSTRCVAGHLVAPITPRRRTRPPPQRQLPVVLLRRPRPPTPSRASSGQVQAMHGPLPRRHPLTLTKTRHSETSWAEWTPCVASSQAPGWFCPARPTLIITVEPSKVVKAHSCIMFHRAP